MSRDAKSSNLVKGAVPRRGRGVNSRRSQVYEILLERLKSGELQPGMRLREAELADMLEVSRTPVREALARLQARGLAEQGASGVVVAQLTRAQTFELYAMRAALEGTAARMAAESATSVDLDMLRLTAERFAASGQGAAKLAETNKQFHDVIVASAHNRYLARMLADLTDSLALLPNTTFAKPGRATEAVDEHRAILSAIETRDADAAENAARQHIEKALQARLSLMFD